VISILLLHIFDHSNLRSNAGTSNINDRLTNIVYVELKIVWYFNFEHTDECPVMTANTVD